MIRSLSAEKKQARFLKGDRLVANSVAGRGRVTQSSGLHAPQMGNSIERPPNAFLLQTPSKWDTHPLKTPQTILWFTLAQTAKLNQKGRWERTIINTRTDLGDCTDAEWQVRVDLAAAHRLAVHYGYHEGIDNHFTALVPGHVDRFLLAPFGLHWSEIRARDFLVVDFSGNVLSGVGPVEDTAFYIHAPVHAARPDIACVMHTHMPYATALSMLEVPELLMASQNAIGFAGLVAHCNYLGFALDSGEGRRMATALGDKPVLLLRNHGVVVTGTSVADAFNALYFFERAAMAQILAQSSRQKLRLVPEPALSLTIEQYKTSAKVEGLARTDLHFAALKRMLDRSGSDYGQ